MFIPLEALDNPLEDPLVELLLAEEDATERSGEGEVSEESINLKRGTTRL